MRTFTIFFRRYPSAWWLATVLTSVCSGLLIFQAVSTTHAEAARLGGLTPIEVSARPVAAGTAVQADDVQVVDWPRALLPQAALDQRAVGRVAAVDIAAGTPLSANLFSDSAISGPSALLRDNERGVTFPREGNPPLAEGDWVDLYSSGGSPERGTAPLSAQSVGEGLRVIGVDDETVTVAAPSEITGMLAAALGGRVTAVLTKPGSAPAQ